MKPVEVKYDEEAQVFFLVFSHKPVEDTIDIIPGEVMIGVTLEGEVVSLEVLSVESNFPYNKYLRLIGKNKEDFK